MWLNGQGVGHPASADVIVVNISECTVHQLILTHSQPLSVQNLAQIAKLSFVILKPYNVHFCGCREHIKLHHSRALYNTSLFRRVVQNKSILRKNHVKGSLEFAKIHNSDAVVMGKIQSPVQSCLARSQIDLCGANLTIHTTSTMKYGGGSIMLQGYFSSAGTKHLITRTKNGRHNAEK